MHQFRRERTEGGTIIATLEDYAAVYRLVAQSLAEGLEAEVPERIRQLVETVGELLKENEKRRDREFAFGRNYVSQIQIAKKLGRDQSVVSRNVAAAIEAGYLVNEAPGQGREAQLIVGERQLPSGAVLPDPRELAAEEEVTELLAQ